MTGPSPSQTIGPFFHFGMEWMNRSDPVDPGSPGAVEISGTLSDGAGAGVPDAMLELWQADGSGGLGSNLFGRVLTDPAGRYRFTTVKPGRVDADQAPHVDVSVFARGLLQRLVTRIYFPDEAEANRTDPLLSTVEPARRSTLVAVTRSGGLTFDIRLQGPGETVFLVW